MLETIDAYIKQHRLLPEKGIVVVAVSGGADSLCLLHLLHRLCGPTKCYPDVLLHVAHFDHQLRGEVSRQDASTVAVLAHSWHLPVSIGQADVYMLARQEHRSLEEMARIARYGFLRELAQQVNATAIAVAHHMDDQVETLLLHWLRGGGLASMVGLQPRQQDIIRPLLCVSRVDTQVYCARHELAPLEDASNNDTRFLRNRIRHELLPLLIEMNPGYRNTLLRNAEAMQVDFGWIETQVDSHWTQIVSHVDNERVQLHLPPLQALPLSLRRHFLRRASALLCAGQSPLEVRHYQLIEQVMQRTSVNTTVTLHLPQKLRFMRFKDSVAFERVYIDNTSIEIAREESSEALLAIPGSVTVPGTSWVAHADLLADDLLAQIYPALRHEDWTTIWHLLQGNEHEVYIDADRLENDMFRFQQTQLYVRTRRNGDRIQPLGMIHEKKVQDILVDKHIPYTQRAHIPLFFSALHCVWLAGIQVDNRVRLTAKTRRIVRLSIVPIES
jgi:tRNA(Ile)-lysidine synthase